MMAKTAFIYKNGYFYYLNQDKQLNYCERLSFIMFVTQNQERALFP